VIGKWSHRAAPAALVRWPDAAGLTVRPVPYAGLAAHLPLGARPSVDGEVRLPATAGGWVAVALDVRLYLRDEITTQLMAALRVVHGGFPATPAVAPLPAVAMIVRGGHSGDVQERTPLQRLVDTTVDRAEARSPTVKYDMWMPSLESLLLPRDPPHSPRAALPAAHRYRTHTVQPFDTPALRVWVSPAGGVTAPPGASSYSGDPITERITNH